MIKFSRFSSLILEQAALTGPSVAYLLFLARYTGKEEFILISFGYSIYIIFGTIFDAIVLEPMLIMASSADPKQNRYLRSIWNLILFSSIVSILMWVVLWVYTNSFVSEGIALSGGFLPGFIVTAFLRKRLHTEGHMSSLPASLGYVIAFFLSAAAFYIAGLGRFWVPLPFVVGGLAFAAFARRAVPLRQAEGLGPNLLRDHARIAVSTTFYSICANLTLNVYPLIFAALSDPAAIPAFRLASLAFTPFFQAWAAIYNFVLPRLQVSRVSDVDPTVRLMLSLVVFAPFAGWLIAAFWGRPLAALLFGSRYIDLGNVLPIAMFGVCASILGNTIGMWFRSHRGFAAVRAMGLAQLAVTATLAWPLSAAWGARGAFAAYSLANGIALGTAVFMWWRAAR